MSNIVNINNIFAIGRRCNTEEFIHMLNIRKYASPFSYMVIDINTSLDFIQNNFLNYTNKDFIEPGKNTFTFNRINWPCNNIHKCSIIPNDDVDILELDKVCIWNHHDLYDEKIIDSFNRRSRHLLRCLSEKPDTTLLIYIEKIQKYGEKDCYFDKNILDKYNCNFLIILPLLNFNSDPLLFYDNSRIRIIYFNSDLQGWATDTNYNIEEWNKLKIFVNTLYKFNIENRNDDQTNS